MRTMRLLGARSLEELGPSHVTQLERLVPRPRGPGIRPHGPIRLIRVT